MSFSPPTPTSDIARYLNDRDKAKRPRFSAPSAYDNRSRPEAYSPPSPDVAWAKKASLNGQAQELRRLQLLRSGRRRDSFGMRLEFHKVRSCDNATTSVTTPGRSAATSRRRAPSPPTTPAAWHGGSLAAGLQFHSAAQSAAANVVDAPQPQPQPQPQMPLHLAHSGTERSRPVRDRE